MEQLKGVDVGKSFAAVRRIGFARQGRRRSRKRIPDGRAVEANVSNESPLGIPIGMETLARGECGGWHQR